MRPVDLLEEVIEAHGGRRRWQSVDVIEASFSAGGLAFASRFQRQALRSLGVSLKPHARRLVLQGYGRPDWCGVWTPTHVQILDENDSVVSQRHDPRPFFASLGKQFRWDRLDLLYFTGYALWNYLCFPFILEAPGVSIIEWSEAGVTTSRRLLASFDECGPTHSRFQAFHIDESGLLDRHDYTADVIGHWATAANYCLASEQVEGLRFYTRRRVYPRIGARLVLPFPTLVWIEIDDIHLILAEGNCPRS